MPDDTHAPVELFISYAHYDEELREELGVHLAQLKHEQSITDWHDRLIIAGQEWAGKIDEHLNSARVILLLVSPRFIASRYCYDIEVKRAMERHEAGEAVVIPVILRPCDWNATPFSKLQALPTYAQPITLWQDRDSAFLNVAQGIRRAIEELRERQTKADTAVATKPTSKPASFIPRPPAVGFVARRDSQGRDILNRLLEELPGGRMVALWGPGGSGKSTLAAEAARALLSRFPERLAWVSALGRNEFSLTSLLDDIITQLAPGIERPATLDAKEAEALGIFEKIGSPLAKRTRERLAGVEGEGE